jgi:hypothetical protein
VIPESEWDALHAPVSAAERLSMIPLDTSLQALLNDLRKKKSLNPR